MKWCDEHWAGLKAEVERQGLWGFVPDTATGAASAFARSADGEASIDSFDPLMGGMMAMNDFMARAMGPGGALAVWTLDGCPICKVDEVHKQLCPEGDACTQPSIATFFKNAIEDQVSYLKAMQNG